MFMIPYLSLFTQKISRQKSQGEWVRGDFSRINHPLTHSPCYTLKLVVLFKIDKAVAETALGKDILWVSRINLDLLAKIGDVEAE